MSIPERPDLSDLDPAVRAYVEALESELERLRASQSRRRPARAESVEPVEPAEPAEPPTTFNVISISAGGLAKRTPRHLYSRQRRGGMGVFDLETPEDDPPAFLVVADESQDLALVTDRARTFRLPVDRLPESPVHARGQPLNTWLPLLEGERPAVVLPGEGGPFVALLTARGYVRWLASNLLGKGLRPGAVLYDVGEMGVPAAACWTSSGDDLFVTTRQGIGIRFSARQVPMRGCLGIQLKPGDEAAAIASVRSESGVFLMGGDGKGTIRLMSGFRANKSPGSRGKTAFRCDHLVGGVAVDEGDDLFAISRLGKIIRFRAVEIPLKEGVVQGVNCMALRADETTALVATAVPG